MRRLVLLLIPVLLSACEQFHDPLRTMKPVVNKSPWLAPAPDKANAKPLWRLQRHAFYGDVVNGRFHGKGQCSYFADTQAWQPYEDCEYVHGVRVDTTWAKVLLADEARIENRNSEHWAQEAQRAKWRDENRARKDAEAEAKMHAAVQSTLTAMRTGQMPAGAGFGADTLNMARQMGQVERDLSVSQQASRPAYTPVEVRSAELRVLAQQQATARLQATQPSTPASNVKASVVPAASASAMPSSMTASTQGSEAESAPAKKYRNPGEDAMACLAVSPGTNKVVFSNSCSVDIFLLYCGSLTYSSKRCGDGPSGGYYTSSANLAPGQSKEVSVKGQYQYAACKGRIGFGNDKEYTDKPNGDYACLKR